MLQVTVTLRLLASCKMWDSHFKIWIVRIYFIKSLDFIPQQISPKMKLCRISVICALIFDTHIWWVAHSYTDNRSTNVPETVTIVSVYVLTCNIITVNILNDICEIVTCYTPGNKELSIDILFVPRYRGQRLVQILLDWVASWGRQV